MPPRYRELNKCSMAIRTYFITLSRRLTSDRRGHLRRALQLGHAMPIGARLDQVSKVVEFGFSRATLLWGRSSALLAVACGSTAVIGRSTGASAAAKPSSRHSIEALRHRA